MPEIKNTFIKSKMNKDLDDRLMPPGEYRDAQNVSISRSEDADVGALENVLGNIIKSDFAVGEVCNGLVIIGYYMDVPGDRVFVMMTNYTDNSTDKLSNFATTGSHCSIREYNIKTNTARTLVRGRFLNFSKTHPVYHINLLEDLLFWTDDRNQPRKINIELAKGRIKQVFGSPVQYYYHAEDQISVAKYYPHKPIDLIRVLDSGGESTMKDRVSEFLPNAYPPHLDITGWPHDPFEFTDVTHGYGYAHAHLTTYTTDGDGNYYDVGTTGGSGTGLTVNIKVESSEDYAGVTHQDPVKHNGVITAVEINNPGSGYIDGEVLTVNPVPDSNGALRPDVNPGSYLAGTNALLKITVKGTDIKPSKNPYYYKYWPGDPSYLKDKFLRFSYRFKFDDGEYSLMAPFTQIAFIPEQDGYFIDNDENRTYQSTEVNFFKNKINDINLIINAPDDMTFSSLYNDLKVIEIDILARESDGLSVKVLDTIKKDTFKYLDPVSNHTLNNTPIFEYNYQSRKPYKTLPERDTIRVYDKIPVRALTQEIVSNRVVYGNYKNKHTPPEYIDYNVSSREKLEEDPEAVITSYNIKEYPNHTLKQNRTYQVGIVLSDRYGRQSSVILSSVDTGETVGNKFYGGSTVHHPYRSSKDPLITLGVGNNPADTWPGDSLQVLFNKGIQSIKSSKTGEPGLYNEETNPLGWYSYKIVVKQQEQDYYNIYFPGILNGTFNKNNNGGYHRATPSEPVCHITLQGDNINKIPRDLKNVGPDQKVFRTSRPIKTENPLWYSVVNEAGEEGAISFDDWNSQEARNFILQRNIELGLTESAISENASVEMYCRVENIRNFPCGFENRQFNPGFLSDTVVNIGTLSDLGMVDPGGDLPIEIHNVTSNPLIARIEAQDFNIGVSSDSADTYSPKRPILAVYEVQPVISRLRLFWETTTSGLVSELNKAIIEGEEDQPQEIANWGMCGGTGGLGPFCNETAKEDIQPHGVSSSILTSEARVTNSFWALDAAGNILSNATIYLDGVVDQNGANADDKFEIAEHIDPNSGLIIPGWFYIYLTDYEWFGKNEDRRIYTFRLFVINAGIGNTFEFEGGLDNVAPFAGYIDMSAANGFVPAEVVADPVAAWNANKVGGGDDTWIEWNGVEFNNPLGNSFSNPTTRFADATTEWDLLVTANGSFVDDQQKQTFSAWEIDNYPRLINELEISVVKQERQNSPYNNTDWYEQGNTPGDGYFFIQHNWDVKAGNSNYPYAFLQSDFRRPGFGVPHPNEIFKITVEWRDCNGFSNPNNPYKSSRAVFYCKTQVEIKLSVPAFVQRDSLWPDPALGPIDFEHDQIKLTTWAPGEDHHVSIDAETRGLSLNCESVNRINFIDETSGDNMDISNDFTNGVFTVPATGNYELNVHLLFQHHFQSDRPLNGSASGSQIIMDSKYAVQCTSAIHGSIRLYKFGAGSFDNNGVGHFGAMNAPMPFLRKNHPQINTDPRLSTWDEPTAMKLLAPVNTPGGSAGNFADRYGYIIQDTAGNDASVTFTCMYASGKNAENYTSESYGTFDSPSWKHLSSGNGPWPSQPWGGNADHNSSYEYRTGGYKEFQFAGITPGGSPFRGNKIYLTGSSPNELTNNSPYPGSYSVEVDSVYLNKGEQVCVVMETSYWPLGGGSIVPNVTTHVNTPPGNYEYNNNKEDGACWYQKTTTGSHRSGGAAFVNFVGGGFDIKLLEHL